MVRFFSPISDSILDYHQQGGGIYHAKGWDTKDNRKRYREYAKKIIRLLNMNAKDKYSLFTELYDGADGVGGSLTDYANSIATGMKWSTKYGRMVLADKNNEEIPLIVYYGLDKYKEHHIQQNPTLVTGTLEISRTREAYGNSCKARIIRREEYLEYNFDKLLQYRAEIARCKNIKKESL